MTNSETIDSGIYKITNIVTGRIYVGSAINLHNRKSFHFSEAQHNRYLKRSMKKYGKKNFTFEVIEYCSPEQLLEREQYYLNTLLFAREYIETRGQDNRFEKLGYNNNPTAHSRFGAKLSFDIIEKLKTSSYFNVMKRDKVWAEKMLNTKKLNGTLKRNSETKQKISRSHKGRPKSEPHRQAIRESGKKRWKAVLQYDINGNFIAEYPSIAIATQIISKENNIPKGLLNIVGVVRGLTKYSKGFIFRYKREENYPLKININLGPIYSQDGKQRQKQKAKINAAKRKKPILLYDRFTGSFIAEYEGMIECERATGIGTQRLRAVLQGRSKYTHDKIVRYKACDDFPLHIDPILNQYDDEQRRKQIMKKIHLNNSQPILAYDLKGRLINEYTNANEAAIRLGIGIQNAGGIRMVLYGRCEQCKGYRFKYKNPNYTPRKYKPRQVGVIN